MFRSVINRAVNFLRKVSLEFDCSMLSPDFKPSPIAKYTHIGMYLFSFFLFNKKNK